MTKVEAFFSKCVKSRGGRFGFSHTIKIFRLTSFPRSFLRWEVVVGGFSFLSPSCIPFVRQKSCGLLLDQLNVSFPYRAPGSAENRPATHAMN